MRWIFWTSCLRTERCCLQVTGLCADISHFHGRTARQRKREHQPGKGARPGHCKKGWWLLRASVRCRVCPAVRNCPLQMWMVRNLIRQAGQSLRNLSAGFVGSDGALHLRSGEQGRACGEPAAPPGWPVSLDHTSPGPSFLWANRGKVWALPSRGTAAAEQHSLPCSGM